jgi:hypothetical protein
VEFFSHSKRRTGENLGVFENKVPRRIFEHRAKGRRHLGRPSDGRLKPEQKILLVPKVKMMMIMKKEVVTR